MFIISLASPVPTRIKRLTASTDSVKYSSNVTPSVVKFAIGVVDREGDSVMHLLPISSVHLMKQSVLVEGPATRDPEEGAVATNAAERYA